MVLSHLFQVKLFCILLWCRIDGRINYEKVMDIAKVYSTKNHRLWSLAHYAREIDFKNLEIADAVGAILFADIAHILLVLLQLVNIWVHSLCRCCYNYYSQDLKEVQEVVWLWQMMKKLLKNKLCNFPRITRWTTCSCNAAKAVAFKKFRSIMERLCKTSKSKCKSFRRGSNKKDMISFQMEQIIILY